VVGESAPAERVQAAVARSDGKVGTGGAGSGPCGEQ